MGLKNIIGEIYINFLLGKGYGDSIENVKRMKRFKYLPLLFSHLLSIILNINTLKSADIIVGSNLEFDGFIVCLISKIFHKKAIITIHGHYDEEWVLIHKHLPIRIFLLRLYEQFVIKNADLITVNDEQIKEKLIKKNISSKISVRYLFVDYNKFSRKNIDIDIYTKIMQKYEINSKYILFVGRLHEWDGIFDLLDIFKKINEVLPNYKCVLVGEYGIKNDSITSKKDILSYIKKLELTNRIIITRWVNHDLVKYFYYGADLVILPMKPPQAGVGRILLESLSMEVPVIVSDIGEFHRLIVNGETGFRVPLGDNSQFAEKSIYMLMDRSISKALGSKGRALVKEKYGLDTYLTNWANSVKMIWR